MASNSLIYIHIFYYIQHNKDETHLKTLHNLENETRLTHAAPNAFNKI